MMRSLELFAGAGGMALGLHRAGFRADALIEYSHAACDTLRSAVADGRLCGEVIEGDAGAVDYTRFFGVDLVCGGPPCQPFSAAGKGLGADDERDGWPHFIKAVREARPRCFLAENVRGFLSEKFTAYRMDIMRELESMGYAVRSGLLNAADYGLPQTRPRVFLVGALGAVPPWPAQTHADPRLGASLFGLPAWVGARSVGLNGHIIAGATKPDDMHPLRSVLRPAACLLASQPLYHIPPTGGYRAVPPAEAALLSGFPSDWPFSGAEAAKRRQVGNAVPPPLAEALGRAIAQSLQPAADSD